MWTTDEFGNKTFTLDGWEIKVYSDGTIYFTEPDNNWQVEVTDDGLVVFGESTSGYASCGVRVHIPFTILRELLRVIDNKNIPGDPHVLQ